MEKKYLLKQYVLVNNKLVSWREIDGEMILLDKKKKTFYEMNKTANYIWKEAVKKQKIEDVVTTVQKKYKKTDKKTAEKDTLSFINDLVKEKYFLLGS